MSITSGYTGLINFASNTEIKTSLVIASEQRIKSSSSAIISFTGTPAHNSNLTYIQNTCTNPFDTATSRDNLLFKLLGSAVQKIDAGVYPHMELDRGFRPEYVAPTLATNKYTVKMLSITIGAIQVSPTTAVPSADDRLMNWILEDVINHANSAFQFNLTANFNFDGGWGTWTFQAKSGGWLLPMTGNLLTFGSTFTWRRIIIASTKGGSGSFIKIPYGSILSLNDLTINAGASMKGDDSYGATIHLINRPTIKGTWGFYPVADGIYHYKGLYNLNVAFGGTGITSVPQGEILFGVDIQTLGSSSNFTFGAGNTLSVGLGGMIIPPAALASLPPAANQLWVNSADSNKLYFGTSEVGGGGGGGSMSSFTLAGSSGTSQTIANGNTLTIAQGTGITAVASATDTVTITNTGVTSNVAGTGISVSGATGAVTVANTGVTSNVAGTGISVSSGAGAVTVANTGVLSNIAGKNTTVSSGTGNVTIDANFVAPPAGAVPAFGQVPSDGGKAPFGWVAITLNTGQVVHVPCWV